jgi:hypothetical protein
MPGFILRLAWSRVGHTGRHYGCFPFHAGID